MELTYIFATVIVSLFMIGSVSIIASIMFETSAHCNQIPKKETKTQELVDNIDLLNSVYGNDNSDVHGEFDAEDD
tara:strand:+ start:1150 stop:1374 length:225 start_codon:yes stop_codon:yes gene_type:complete